MATSGPPRAHRQQPQTGHPPPTKYYFAYGSNLCLNQMKKRCPDSRYIGTARLSNHLWHINERGYANVRAAEGHWVEGLVYEIDEADEASLDMYEGVSKNAYHKCLTRVLLQRAPGALHRRPVAWIVDQGGPAEVSRRIIKSADGAAPRPDVPPRIAANTLTYINLALTGDSRPKKEYVRRMNLGIADAVALGISEDYVRRYMRPCIPKAALLDPRESEPKSLKKKKSASPARGRNAATPSRSREFASTGKSRAFSLPPERKRDGRSFSRGRSQETSNPIKEPVRSEGPPPLPPQPPPLPPGPPPLPARPPPSTPNQPIIVIEEAPRQSSWKWWPLSS